MKRLLTTVPVRKPNRQEFVKVHADAAYRLTPGAIIDLNEDREVYLVTPEMAAELPGGFVVVTLFVAINPAERAVRLAGPPAGSDGKHNEWHRSAAEAAERAMQAWVRVTANMSLGAYEIAEAMGKLGEPEWPQLDFDRFWRSPSVASG